MKFIPPLPSTKSYNTVSTRRWSRQPLPYGRRCRTATPSGCGTPLWLASCVNPDYGWEMGQTRLRELLRGAATSWPAKRPKRALLGTETNIGRQVCVRTSPGWARERERERERESNGGPRQQRYFWGFIFGGGLLQSEVPRCLGVSTIASDASGGRHRQSRPRRSRVTSRTTQAGRLASSSSRNISEPAVVPRTNFRNLKNLPSTRVSVYYRYAAASFRLCPSLPPTPHHTATTRGRALRRRH